MFNRNVTSGLKELDARQGRAHFKTGKTGGPCRSFASIQNRAANAAPRPFRMDEEGANLGCIVKRVQQLVFSFRPAVATVEGLPLAPAAAADNQQSWFSGFGKADLNRIDFSHQVGFICN